MASALLNEQQAWHPDAIERQLAHAPRNKVRATYNYAAPRARVRFGRALWPFRREGAQSAPAKCEASLPGHSINGGRAHRACSLTVGADRGKRGPAPAIR